jgi:lipopolysaccharide assembly outer membrane protein LptD (OstA)
MQWHNKYSIVLLLLLSVTAIIYAEPPGFTLPFDPYTIQPKIKDSTLLSNNEKMRRIEILQSDLFAQSYDSNVGITKRKLWGHVRLRHKTTTCSSDSATLFVESNYVEAGGSVHIRNGDTLHIYSDFVKYYGDMRIATLSGNVILDNGKMQMHTPALDYDMDKDVGNYFQGATFTKDSTTITSIEGRYEHNKELAYFKKNVRLTTIDYTIYADSMRYDIRKDIAYFVGKTLIVGDEDTIVTTSGYYDNSIDKLSFDGRTTINRSDASLSADSIDIDKKNNSGTAVGNVSFVHKEENFEIQSGTIIYTDSSGYSKAYNDPLLLQIDTAESDTLYLSADTILSYYTYFVKDSVIGIRDSARIMNTYHHTKIFQKDMSAIADSLYADYRDSIMILTGNPLAWMDSTQISADTLLLYMKNKKVHEIVLHNNAFIATMNEDSLFDQIKGHDIHIYLREDEIEHIFVDGNAESIYFLKNDNSEYMGGNRTKSAYIQVKVLENDIQQISLLQAPEAEFTPMKDIDPDTFLLDGFHWHWGLKPKDKWAIIRNVQRYQILHGQNEAQP